MDNVKFFELLRHYGVYHQYALKGSYIYGPYVTQLLDKIKNKWINITGITPTLLPSFVPLNQLKKEKVFGVNIKEVYNIGKDTVLKPTSEAVLYSSDYFRNAIKRKKDLPFIVLAFNSVYRYENRSVPLIRLREIMGFTEIHHVDIMEVNPDKMVKKFLKQYSDLAEYLEIPYIILERFDEDKFLGAHRTIALDTVVFGKKLQLCTVHHLSALWSETYGLDYYDNMQKKRPSQFCYGHSERLVFALLYTHYNEQQDTLILPKHLRSVEVIFVDTPYFEITFADLITHCSENNLRKHIMRAKWCDNIIIIINKKYKKVRVIDRTIDYYMFLEHLNGFSFRTLKPSRYVNKGVELFKKYIVKDKNTTEQIWGFNGQNIYAGPQY